MIGKLEWKEINMDFINRKNWKSIKLSEVADINKETITKQYPFEYIAYIDVASVENREINEIQYLGLKDAPSRAKRIIKPEDILISTVRPNLKHYVYVKNPKENYVASTGFAVISAKSVSSKYLYYYLTSEPVTDYLAKIADGHTSAYPSFNPSVLEKMEIPLPDTREQKEIADLLGCLDDKIELLHKENKTLETIAQTLFMQWFIDFEFPNEDGKSYKSSGGGMIDSELGQIPEGWEVSSLSDTANFLNGLAMQKFPPKNDKEYLPVVKIKEMKSGITVDSDRASKDIDEKYIVRFGDLLFSWSGSLDLVLWDGEDGALNQHLFKVTSDKYPQWFYYYWILFHLPEFKAIAQSKATTMGHIQRHHLDQALVVIPQEKVLETVNVLISPLFNKRISNLAVIRSLVELKNNLIINIFRNE